ncbi:high-affinity choline transporter 1 [Rhipicephalus sanguineus]|uniref:high-affinity choline transporter 1 n=1 Tax=Rhipicephalus sanguineus TaxID=34632 RepID=UPI0020C58009|nr:high-affinity choline transporter 1 [Rhipicephalus sanguineus]
MRATKPMTMLDPFQTRYGRWMALLLCFPAVVGEVFWTAAVLAALGDTAYAIMEVDVRFFIIASALVVFFYTSLGGVYVVTHTDVLQITSTTICLWICVPFCLHHQAVGLIGPPHDDWIGTIAHGEMSKLLDAFLMTALGGIPWQVYFQRVLSCESDFDARMLSYLSAVGCIMLAIPPAVIGAVAKSANFTAAGYPGPYFLRNKDSNRVLPNSIRYLTSGLVSIMGLIGITAAIMSSADSSMLSASSMVTKNVYQSFIRPTASDVEVSLVLRIMVFAIGSWATYLALSVESVFDLWTLCSDFVYVLLFPQLICVLYFEGSNTYGSLLAFFVSLVFRWMCGEPLMNVPVILRLPLYDEESGQQVFPFRLTCMLIGLITQLLGSYCASLAFHSGWLPQRLDVFRCFAPTKSKPTDPGSALLPQGSESSPRNDVSANDNAPKGSRKTSAADGSSKARKTSAAEVKKPRKTTGDSASSKVGRQQSVPSQKDVETEAASRQAPEPTTAKSDLPNDSKKAESKPEPRRPSEPSKGPSKKERRSRSRVQIDVPASVVPKSDGEQPKEE